MMITTRPEALAFETTKEIVIAGMATAQHKLNSENGELVGEYFRAIYNQIFEIIKSDKE